MDNPTSGNSAVDTSVNLGDTSKLSFLDSLQTETTDPGQTGESQTVESTDPVEMGEEQTGTESESGVEEAPTAAKVNDGGVLTPSKSARDYSDIDPADVPLFKKMANDSFLKAKEWYKAQRDNNTKFTELETNFNKIKDQQFWSHPEAYRLSEDYNKASAEYQAAATISNYWTEALAAVRAGNPIKDLTTDDKGNFMLGQELQPSPQLESKILQTLVKTSGIMQNAEQRLAGAKDTFGNRYKQFEGFLGQVESNLLGEVRKNPEFQKLESGMLNLMPPELRGTKQFQLIAGMGAFIKALTGELTKMKAQLEGKKVVSAAERSNGPGTGKPVPSGGNNTVESVLKGIARHVGRA